MKIWQTFCVLHPGFNYKNAINVASLFVSISHLVPIQLTQEIGTFYFEFLALIKRDLQQSIHTNPKEQRSSPSSLRRVIY